MVPASIKLYLFRHGEIANPNGIVQGRLPGFHLSESGKADVRKEAALLQGAGITKIYTSPLDRAKETSEIIRGVLGLTPNDIIVREELIEVDCKSWEGRPLALFLRESDYATNPESQTATENLLDAGMRVMSVMNEAVSKQETAVLVSHGDPIVGALINITHDWDEFYTRYPERGTFVQLKYHNGIWAIIRSSH